jgi:hypothetical protein
MKDYLKKAAELPDIKLMKHFAEWLRVRRPERGTIIFETLGTPGIWQGEDFYKLSDIRKQLLEAYNAQNGK